MISFKRCYPTFSKSRPIANRLHPKASSLKVKIPTSPESDGEIYLTPNTSVSIDDDRKNSLIDDLNDAVFVEYMRPPPRSKNNGYRIDKIQSMSSIANNNNNNNININNHQRHTTDDPLIEQRMYEKPFAGEGQSMFRINSLGNLSQYERDFGSTPKSLLKLREEFERRRVALVAQRNSLNLKKSNEAAAATAAAAGNEKNAENGLFTRSVQRAHKKRFGIGDTKYIGTENDTPESKQLNLTKMKSLGTISDPMNANERITYDPFLTPSIPRRHPSSLHSFEEEEDIRNNFNSDSNGSSDEQENFLRHHPDEQARFMHETNLLKGSFERGFRRSYNKNHDRMTVPVTTMAAAAAPIAASTVTGLRKSDGCFKMPQPIDKQSHVNCKAGERQKQQQKNRSSVHSLPSDGKYDVTRYDIPNKKKSLVRSQCVSFEWQILEFYPNNNNN